MKTEIDARVVATTLGYLSGIHQQLHQTRIDQSEEDERDIDSAQVLIESASAKLNEVLARHRSIATINTSEED